MLAESLTLLPPSASPRQGSTLPTVFVTVQQALQGIACTTAADCVLIHAAAGGVGLAAIQVFYVLTMTNSVLELVSNE